MYINQCFKNVWIVCILQCTTTSFNKIARESVKYTINKKHRQQTRVLLVDGGKGGNYLHV